MVAASERKKAAPSQPERGQPTDAYGGPVIDPTANVKDLSVASNLRQDDLRDAYERLFQEQLHCVQEGVELRDAHAKELAHAESRRVNEQAALRAEYADKLSVAEAKRIDAIRAVDVNAVSVAAQRANDQATVLATQVAQSAEALRGLVAATANTVAQSQQQLATTLSARITTLEQAGYQQQGKAAYSDPAFLELLSEVKQLRTAGATGPSRDLEFIELKAELKALTGTRAQGIGSQWGIIAVVIGLLLTAAVIIVPLINKGETATAPIVVTVPGQPTKAP